VLIFAAEVLSFERVVAAEVLSFERVVAAEVLSFERVVAAEVLKKKVVFVLLCRAGRGKCKFS
jgi:hypothetical protein